MEQTFEQLKHQFDNLEHHEALDWMQGGNSYQRHFYRLNGIHIIQNTYFPYSFLKKTSTWFWIDMLMDNSKENIALLKLYGGQIRMDVSYTDELNKGILQFDNANGMLKFIADGY